MDGISASEQSAIDKGFMQLGTENIDTTTARRNLTVTVLTQYNNTDHEIQCLATDFVNQGLLGGTGILLVQGKLLLMTHFLMIM